ncbi:alpha/beta hydrolase [Janthinobacterium psychrotolerans]|uniref:Acetyl esterase/lipase n=1 Tax=Janthinobacterium psychrotolerans TaxID=1747903 RepID=A0A1A7BWS8_9BURK|nr:alpha/beta hydrolase [Janthinobacterium psychrotolerans]OBV37967.1 Acetyl esterase/lipase [Janthinobacterium psychrotolerans]
MLLSDTNQPGLAELDAATLDEARRFNRRLAWAPRLRIRNRAVPMLVQSLLRLGQVADGARLARAGVRARRHIVDADGLKVPVRILAGARPARAVVLDFHGGGWVIGNAQMNDPLNIALVKACDVAVVSVDYRLMPAHTLQDMLDDCLAAARWLLGGGDDPAWVGLPVLIVGESAGGHLAAATLLRLKAWPQLLARVKGAVLYYGVYDLAATPSVRAAGPDTLLLHGPSMATSMRMLTPGLSEEEQRLPPLSPLYGALDGMPPALMVAGERDPLLDDTVLMARRWEEVAQVELHLLPEAAHGFIRFPIALARRVQARTHQWINERIAAVKPSS